MRDFATGDRKTMARFPREPPAHNDGFCLDRERYVLHDESPF